MKASLLIFSCRSTRILAVCNLALIIYKNLSTKILNIFSSMLLAKMEPSIQSGQMPIKNSLKCSNSSKLLPWSKFSESNKPLLLYISPNLLRKSQSKRQYLTRGTQSTISKQNWIPWSKISQFQYQISWRCKKWPQFISKNRKYAQYTSIQSKSPSVTNLSPMTLATKMILLSSGWKTQKNK